jgi:dTDP-4-dehydrorhamnose 3,5-epimerase
MTAQTQQAPMREAVLPIGERNGLELAVPSRGPKSVGDVILAPDSSALIDGVRIDLQRVYPDDRGFFTELARLGSAGLAEKMVPGGEARIQISATLTYPGTIKAIHYHFEQTDLWLPVSGMLQVFLCDLRRASPTFGKINTVFAGTLRPWAVLIPPGVAHGYKVIGVLPAMLVYLTNRFYNPSDEGRLAYDHPGIAYDWETQHK